MQEFRQFLIEKHGYAPSVVADLVKNTLTTKQIALGLQAKSRTRKKKRP